MDMGGAPPHTDNLIRSAAGGRRPNRTVEKTRRVRILALSCNSLDSLWNMAWLALEHLFWTWLDSLWNMAWLALEHLFWTWLDSRWNISFELGLTLGAWLSCLSLLNISGAALVTLPRHRLNQPSIRRRRIEGTTSKYNELNAYGRKESFLWRHAAASTSLVFPPESTRRRTNNPRGFRGQRPEQRIWRKQTTSSLLIVNKQVPLTKSILLIELVKLDLNAVTEHRASVVIFAGQVKRLNS